MCRESDYDSAVLVVRGNFSMEDPWAVPPGCERVPLRRATDGRVPRLGTTVALYHDDECLHALFQGHDDGIVASYLGHDDPLYEQDVMEAFLAPHDKRVYYEIEVSPLGATFDARIESPDGVRGSLRADRGWDCEGLFAAVRRTPSSIETIVRVPFASIGARPPGTGEEWWGNFFRIDRSPSGDEFSAWSPTMKNPADFHVAAAFGKLVFR